jgi:hypothetical protein
VTSVVSWLIVRFYVHAIGPGGLVPRILDLLLDLVGAVLEVLHVAFGLWLSFHAKELPRRGRAQPPEASALRIPRNDHMANTVASPIAAA